MLKAYCSYEKLQIVSAANPTALVLYSLPTEDTSVVILSIPGVMFIMQDGVLPESFSTDFPNALKVGALSW